MQNLQEGLGSNSANVKALQITVNAQTVATMNVKETTKALAPMSGQTYATKRLDAEKKRKMHCHRGRMH
jgi:hypothetical protein